MAVAGTTHRVGGVTDTLDFEGFYSRERVPLYRALALTIGDSDLAAEAVDEAMVRAYQRWRRVCVYDNPAGWVYRVALNWAISRKRRRRPTPPLVPGAAFAAPPATPDAALTHAIASLPHNQRAVVVLRFHLDWSTEQIAHALKVPAGTVKSRLHRGLATLRNTLGDDYEH